MHQLIAIGASSWSGPMDPTPFLSTGMPPKAKAISAHSFDVPTMRDAWQWLCGAASDGWPDHPGPTIVSLPNAG